MFPAQHTMICNVMMGGFRDIISALMFKAGGAFLRQAQLMRFRCAKGGLRLQEMYLFHCGAERCCTYTAAQSSLHRQ